MIGIAAYDFAANVNGWIAANWAGYSNAAVLSWLSSDGHLANGCLQLSNTAVADAAVLGVLPRPLRSGVPYTLAFWIKLLSGTTTMQWGLGSRSNASNQSKVVNQAITGAWAQQTLAWTPAADCPDPVIWVATYGATTCTVGVDDAAVTGLDGVSQSGASHVLLG